MAKDLVRTRGYIRRVTIARANIQGVAMKLQTVGTVAAMAQAMNGVTKAMTTMNQQVWFHLFLFIYQLAIIYADNYADNYNYRGHIM